MKFTMQKVSDPFTPWHVYVNGRSHSYHKLKKNAEKEIQKLRRKYNKKMK